MKLQFLRCGIDSPTTYFQQHGVTARTARAAVNVVPAKLPKAILRGTVICSSPLVQRIQPPVYILWGNLGSNAYTTRHRTVKDLKQCIRNKISEILEGMTRHVPSYLTAKLEQSLRNGGRISGIFFKNKMSCNVVIQ